MNEPRRSRIRFTLRGIMLVTALVAVVMCGVEFARRAERARQQAELVAAERAYALAVLRRAEDRLDWSLKMSQKGYVSEGQVSASRSEVERARFELENVDAKAKAVASMLPGGGR